MRNKTLAFCVAAAALSGSGAARAEDFVHRDLTLPAGVWALDVGLGVGHYDPSGPAGPYNGLGFNLELKGGLTRQLQLGVRTGIRVGADGKITQADQYGRAFETETYGTGVDTVANPEISLRYAVIDSPTLDLALEGRLYVPIEEGTKVGIMVALPLQFHFSPTVRFDTGLFVPIIFTDPDTTSVISIPFHLWLQLDDRWALGLLTGVRIYNPGGRTGVPIGVGLNYETSRSADVRFWLLFPNVKDGGSRAFGGGIAFEARF
jgi:hypothetical protein